MKEKDLKVEAGQWYWVWCDRDRAIPCRCVVVTRWSDRIVMRRRFGLFRRVVPIEQVLCNATLLRHRLARLVRGAALLPFRILGRVWRLVRWFFGS